MTSLWLLPIAIAIAASPVAAQIVPDASLPHNSVVTPNGNALTIDGGTVSGSHLFHSFSEFSLPTGTEAFFNNAIGIDNILTRITGERISNIDGVIRANGSTNLFLLNPNGIVFGPNARLDIGGSFFASAAESIQFADGVEFSTNTEALPLLSVTAPVGLQLGETPGAIALRGHLSVPPGETIALVGGEITLAGGILEAPGGRIELVAAADHNHTIGEPVNLAASGDITLSGGASANTSGEGGGSIAIGSDRFSLVEASTLQANTLGPVDGGSVDIRVRQLAIRDGSFIEATATGTGSGADINIRAAESAIVTGIGPQEAQRIIAAALSGTLQPGERTTGLFASISGAGAAGNITIETDNLLLENGAFLSASTFSSGPGGDIRFRGDRIRIEESIVAAVVAFGAPGNGGDIEVEGRSLVIRDGGFLSTTTLGSGPGGDLTVRTSEVVDLQGTPPDSLVPAGLFANSIAGTGAAGDLFVETDRVILGDGGEILTQSGVSLPVGRIPLGGPGGNIEIVARESIEATGQSPDGTFFSGVTTETFSSSNAGNLTIVAPRLVLRQRAALSVSGDGTGAAGNLAVFVPTIRLEMGSKIEAATLVGDGGSIRLQTSDLQLRQGSEISTNAGGNGGNIDIDTDTLVALENSDITANAREGMGGRVTIDAVAIFGTEFREMETPQSDITATSNLGAEFSGIVDIQTPDVDPSQGIVELPEQSTPSQVLVVSRCAAAGSSFVVTGRGGLPPDPTQPFRGEVIWRDFQDFTDPTAEETGVLNPSIGEERSQNSPFIPLTEATGWTIAPDGKISLVSSQSAAAVLPQSECD